MTDLSDRSEPMEFTDPRHEQAYLFAVAGLTASAIAEKLGVGLRTIERWSGEYNWKDDPAIIAHRGEWDRARLRSVEAASLKSIQDQVARYRTVGRMSLELIEEALPNIDAEDLTIHDLRSLATIAAICTDKAELLSGNATARVDIRDADYWRQHHPEQYEAVKEELRRARLNPTPPALGPGEIDDRPA